MNAGTKKTSWATRRWKPRDPAISSFDSIPACGGQTDRHAARVTH